MRDMENNQIKLPPKTSKIHAVPHLMMIEDLKSHSPHHLDLISLNTAAHVFLALIVAVHYAVKRGEKGSVKTFLDGLTPDQQLQFLSTKDKKDADGKTAVQWAPADERKEMDKMLKHYKREADFEVNYGKLALFAHLIGLVGTIDGINFFLNRKI